MNRRVFVAVLNWGLGHASRSVVVIEALRAAGAEVVVASNGDALEFLSRRFPHVNMLEIPDKPIEYHSVGAGIGLLKRSFQQKKINNRQADWMREMARGLGITHIVSDNLYGAYVPGIPSAIITHQVGILSPFFKKRFDRYLAVWLQRFDEVWIPDMPGEDSVAGDMLDNPWYGGKKRFIGHISRLSTGMDVEKDIDLLAVLSGPEPQRTFLERKVIKLFSKNRGRFVLVRGKLDGPAPEIAGVETHAFSSGRELAELLARAEMVICRSGYTSVLDLLQMRSKAVLVPTPQQPEQKYLARRMQDKGWFRSVNQRDVSKLQFPLYYDQRPLPGGDYGESLREVVRRFLEKETGRIL